MKFSPTFIAKKHSYNYLRKKRLQELHKRYEKKNVYISETFYNYLWDQVRKK